ncbi:methyltransferase domain-containing protein [Geodermatophilus sp. CPCC 205761]|uniref:methyltransferase domain-containing protein n=1 Tax=Geodermatophilus sp. CPCC 205761 TaxID=2936597 RepID=UPI003EEFE2E8
MTSGAAQERRPDPDTRALNASFDERPDEYDDLRAAGHMARRRVEYFTGVLDEVPGTVLEVGCGTGTLLRELAARRPDRTFVGIEPLPNYVDFARRRAEEAGLANVRFEVGTGETLGQVVPAGSAGLVVSVDALHHVTDLDRVVAEVRAVSAPTARWRAMEPNRVHPYVWAYHVLTPGERTFAVRDFLRRAGDAGWRLVGSTTLFLYPSGVRRVPAWAEQLERRLEGLRPVAGAVVLDLAVEGVSGARGR